MPSGKRQNGVHEGQDPLLRMPATRSTHDLSETTTSTASASMVLKSPNGSLQVGELVQVLDLLNLGVYVTDRNRRILLWNRKAEEITGHLAQDVIGRKCHESILDHCDKDGHPLCDTSLCPLYRTMKLGKGNDEPILVQARKADGGRVVVSTTCAPLFSDSGDVIGGIETFREETSRISDLELARKIQRFLMAPCLPDIPNVRFDVRYYPHDMIGGDFYSISALDDHKYGIIVGDVMGHGVSAALYTICLTNLTTRFAEHAHDPAGFFWKLNQEVGQFAVDCHFVTAFYGIFDTSSWSLTYSNAGHPGPLHFSAEERQVTCLNAHCLPLGVCENSQYKCSAIRLQPGDVLLAYTDGLTEISTLDGQILGSDGLAEIFVREVASKREEIAERVYCRIVDACSDVALTDDALLLSVERYA